jgi:hypothetical protein
MPELYCQTAKENAINQSTPFQLAAGLVEMQQTAAALIAFFCDEPATLAKKQ